MTGSRLRLLVWLLIALLGTAPAQAAQAHPHVIDGARTLFETTRERLELESRRISQDTGVEAFVIIQPSLNGRSAREAVQAAPVWSHDHEQVVLFLAMAERQVRIEASPTVAERIPDAAWARLIESEMLPDLRSGRNGAAVRAGFSAIGHELAGNRAPSLRPQGDLRALRDILFIIFAGALAAISFNGARHLRLYRGRW